METAPPPGKATGDHLAKDQGMKSLCLVELHGERLWLLSGLGYQACDKLISIQVIIYPE